MRGTTSVFAISNPSEGAAREAVTRRDSDGVDAFDTLKSSARAARAHGAQWSGRFGAPPQRSRDIHTSMGVGDLVFSTGYIPDLRQDARRRKGLADNVVGFSPYQPAFNNHTAAAPAHFTDETVRSFDTDLNRHRMDATVRGGNAGYDRGPALGDAVTSPSMSPKR